MTEEQPLLDEVNLERAKGGCCGDACFAASGAIQGHPLLRAAAAEHVRDMVEHAYFDHQAPDGSLPLRRAEQAGFRGCEVGEDLARGQANVDAVVSSWLDSPTHCTILRDPSFTAGGLGVLSGSDGKYWVLLLGG